ncbi:hypothetical protein GCM10007874_65290 [Labrys miyagiensis]|uniref:Metallo-beta-lactamase domain-containing protein n=1 Tax=Labrys miyagiensis TaxID=346912 RepID=A0ABQ6CT04_9HYPH|nr:MBL fold metallo-hydrolase [Labrys miyagiensis]GLS23508.1 hypothetical protein GCM10007874_65290 [Labrys miyagiensis]
MADKLLISAFDVGLGDCIYCRIPKAIASGGEAVDFHMLVDCGSWSGERYLQAAVKALAGMLPQTASGKRRLDLIVVTHRHKDHIAGFDKALFKQFEIGAIWLSAAMNPELKKSKGKGVDGVEASRALALEDYATQAMRGLASLNLSLGEEMAAFISEFAVANDEALDTLTDWIPRQNGIEARYVHAGQSNADLGLPLAGATIRVLAPEKDIDHYYLGAAPDPMLQALSASFTPQAYGAAMAAPVPASELPANISASDFQRLRSNMLSSALALAAASNQMVNNTSVILRIDWGGKRLLFVGDAEWSTAYRDGKANGSWNVMWNRRGELLKEGVDFLKIGHHGSTNATPWRDDPDGPSTEAGDILDAILPRPVAPAQATAVAVVSTERGRYEPIPRCALLEDLGTRLKDTRNYQQASATAGVDLLANSRFRNLEQDWLGKPQPLRTDFERLLGSPGYVELWL